jgi:prolyl oligopeptidase PreP (S9A serine peptidase family)
VLDALDSKDKIPYVNEIGGMFYNLWQDEKNKVPRPFYTAQRP